LISWRKGISFNIRASCNELLEVLNCLEWHLSLAAEDESGHCSSPHHKEKTYLQTTFQSLTSFQGLFFFSHEPHKERARVMAEVTTTKVTERGSIEGKSDSSEGHRLHGFICPITAEVMMDPVITCDGQTYERRAIEKWFQRGNLTSPMTGLALPTTVVTPNHALRQAMEEYFPKMTAIQNKVFELGEEASILQMALNKKERRQLGRQFKLEGEDLSKFEGEDRKADAIVFSQE
jgi:hypothetical protein